MSALDRYAGWLELLSEKDRAYARAQHEQVATICAHDPSAPTWLRMYYGWTVAALDAEDPADALALAVENEDGDPAEVCRALAAVELTSDEWAQWWPAWHPCAN